MEKFDKVLKRLSGYKGILASLFSLTNGYLMNMDVYGDVTFLYVGGVILIIFGATSYATSLMYKRTTK